MKPTQKNIVSYVKNTRFVVCQINPDGTRGTWYGNLNPLSALAAMSNYIASGSRAVLIPADFNLFRWEKENNINSQTDPRFESLIMKHATKSEIFH